MAKDNLRRLLKDRNKAYRTTINGMVMSKFHLVQMGSTNTTMPCADVQINGQIIPDVPAAEINKELLEALPGTPVTLNKSESGRIEIVGLSKRGPGNIYTYSMILPVTIPMESGATSFVGFSLISVSVSGFTTRPVNIDELETISGFGITLLEGFALFDISGTFIRYV